MNAGIYAYVLTRPAPTSQQASQTAIVQSKRADEDIAYRRCMRARWEWARVKETREDVKAGTRGRDLESMFVTIDRENRVPCTLTERQISYANDLYSGSLAEYVDELQDAKDAER